MPNHRMFAATAALSLFASPALAQQALAQQTPEPGATETVVATANGYSRQPLIKIQDAQGFVRDGLRCGAPQSTPQRRQQVESRLRQFRQSSPVRFGASVAVAASKTVPVWFHVVTRTDNTGNVTDARIQQQMQVLNAAYAGRGFQFTLAGVTRTKNNSWYGNCLSNEMKMKNALAVNPARNLNIYTCTPGSYLGYAYVPDTYPEASKRHGVVALHSSLPGGASTNYNEGDTVTHEVGHHLGLEHTFENGCSAPGDYIADTPPQASPTSGCPVGRDSCAGGGLDPIRNFMDYSYDSCMNTFSDDQSIRMQDMTATYKPSLGT